MPGPIDGVYISEIRMFGCNFAPQGWAECNGQLLDISSNEALFSLLGTMYGGDGRTTFGLPDLRSRVPVHMGTGPGLSPYQIGRRGGSETEVLTISQIPAHNHGGSISTPISFPIPSQSVAGTVTVKLSNNVADSLRGNNKGIAFQTKNSVSTDAPLIYDNDPVFTTKKIAGVEHKLSVPQVDINTNANFKIPSQGGGRGIPNVQPYQVINFCIALYGVYPPRD